MIGFNSTPEDIFEPALDHLHDAGMLACRLGIDTTNGVIRGPGDYDFTAITRALKKLDNAGIWAWLDWMWLPRFVTEGRGTLERYHCWVPASSGDTGVNGTDEEIRAGGGWRAATREEKPECYWDSLAGPDGSRRGTPNADSGEIERFCYAMMSECGLLTRWIGQWNEPDIAIPYYPDLLNPSYKDFGFTKLIQQIIAPAVRGYRRAMPLGMVQVIGPNAATPGALKMLCELEKELCGWCDIDSPWPQSLVQCCEPASAARHAYSVGVFSGGEQVMLRHPYAPGLRLWDGGAAHVYAWGGWPVDATARAEQFIAVWREHGHGRPLINTESDKSVTDGPPTWTDWMTGFSATHPEISGHFRLAPWKLFGDGTVGSYRAKNFTPNAEYRTLKAWHDGQVVARKRRAVR